ncbi:MATE family efflux transporter [uncultured Microscilla sp.]|uniref:MATE family efflux transporter n=1 Tax=uncultured Microscilla sp. TaxID=432653 RepID=UPI00260ED0AD|nr:MATE family efflux transporter [uncultured Microscilla sp.]
MLKIKKIRAYYQAYRKDLAATLKLSYPIMIGQVGVMLMSLIDNVMVGQLGAVPLAASSIANAIFFMLTIFGLGTISIITPLVATRHGKQDKDACGALFSAGIKVAFAFGVLFVGISYLLVSYFDIFAQPEKVVPLAIEYLIIIAFSAIPMMLFMVAKHFAEGISATKPAMYVTYVSAIVNVCLNYVLIYGKLGAPALGLAGAGYATLITRVLMAAGMFWYVFTKPRFRPFLRTFTLFKATYSQTKIILQQGLPAGFQHFFEVSAFAGAAIMVGWLGAKPLAAHQIALNLAAVTYMAATGLGVAGSIRVGNAAGEGSPARIFRAGTSAFMLVFIFMSITCLLFISFNYFLVKVYIDDQQVINIAASLMIIAGFFQLSDGIQVVGLGVLRGIGDVNLPTVITLVSYWFIALPVGYILCFHFNWGVEGMWVGLLLGLTVSAIFLTLRFYRLVYANRKQEATMH